MKSLTGLLLGTIIQFVLTPAYAAEKVRNVIPVASGASKAEDPFGAQLEHLQTVLKFPTVTLTSDLHSTGQAEAFHDLHRFLRQTYPLVFSSLEVDEVGNSLLVKWKSPNPIKKPMLFLAHMDVVPIGAPEDWKHSPFGAVNADGAIWGRGALDMKSAFIGILESLEQLLKQRVTPNRTLYFAFGHDEEAGGEQGAQEIADRLKKQKVHFESVFDEGMTVITDLMATLDRPVALIGTAQKGYLTINISVKGTGGHSSMPPESTAIGRLSRTLIKLEQSPFPGRLSVPVQQMLEALAPSQPFLNQFLFSHLGFFHNIVLHQFLKSPQTAALAHTTLAITKIVGGVKDNVLPQSATATVNFRIIPGETQATTLERVKGILKDDAVVITPDQSSAADPSAPSSLQSEGYNLIGKAISQTFPTAIIAPSLMLGSSDSRHYRELTDNTYLFLPLELKREELQEIHGDNERISVENFKKVISYYRALLTECIH